MNGKKRESEYGAYLRAQEMRLLVLVVCYVTNVYIYKQIQNEIIKWYILIN